MLSGVSSFKTEKIIITQHLEIMLPVSSTERKLHRVVMIEQSKEL